MHGDALSRGTWPRNVSSGVSETGTKGASSNPARLPVTPHGEAGTPRGAPGCPTVDPPILAHTQGSLCWLSGHHLSPVVPDVPTPVIPPAFSLSLPCQPWSILRHPSLQGSPPPLWETTSPSAPGHPCVREQGQGSDSGPGAHLWPSPGPEPSRTPRPSRAEGWLQGPEAPPLPNRSRLTLQ